MTPPNLAACLAGLLLASTVAWANPNQHARVLAGMEPVEGVGKVQGLQQAFGDSRSLLRTDNARTMRDFFATRVPSTLKAERVVYLFGGPDVLYAQVAFPNFKTLLLVGLEPPGDLPNPASFTPAELAQKIGDISRAYTASLQRSYFITSNMAKDLVDYGTTTIIATGLAVQGFDILSVQRVSLNAEGVVQADGDNPTRGVRIQFRRPDGSVAEVLYFRFNLADEHMAKRPELGRFILKQQFDTAFYKAASFVSHNANFKTINGLVLDQVKLLIQADDGIPYSALAARDRAPLWSVELYGVYTPPKNIFEIAPQPALRALFGQAICAGGEAGDRELWEKVWLTGACSEEPRSRFRSVRWAGYLPFRFGYAAVIGPALLPPEEMRKFGTLMVLQR